MAAINPIETLNGEAIACPAKYSISLSDISLPGAGRALDGTMHKKKLVEKYHIDLEFKGLTYAEGVQLISLTAAEFFPVKFLDLKGQMVTKTFYRGDIKAEFLGYGINRWNPLSFSIIER